MEMKDTFNTTLIGFSKSALTPLESNMLKPGPLNGLDCIVNKRHALVYKDPTHANAIIIDYVEGERFCLN